MEDKSPQQAFRVRGEILETAAITIFPITQRFCPQDPCLGGDGQDIMLKMGIENLDGIQPGIHTDYGSISENLRKEEWSKCQSLGKH